MGSFENRYHLYGTLAVQCILFGCALTFYAVVRPYKMNLSNNVDILALVLLAGMSVELCIATNFLAVPQVFAYYALVTILLLLVPHMVLIFYICYLLAKKTGITQCLKKKFKALKSCVQGIRHTSQVEADVEAESITSSLPDRLINPGEYEPVLPTGEEHETTESNERVNEDPKRLIPVYTYGSIS